MRFFVGNTAAELGRILNLNLCELCNVIGCHEIDTEQVKRTGRNGHV